MIRNFIYSIMILSLFSCAMPEETNDVGTVRKFEPVTISTDDYLRIKTVCDSIKSKEATIQQMVDNKVSFAFEYGEKTCEASSIDTFNMFITNIKNVAQDFQFFSTSGTEFGYRNVETSKVGLMVDVCNNLASQVSPIIGQSAAAIWFGSVYGNSICKSTQDATCIVVEFGKKVADRDSYQIHTREWIKFNISGSREGYFTERKTFSSIGCASGLQIEKSAIAK